MTDATLPSVGKPRLRSWPGTQNNRAELSRGAAVTANVAAIRAQLNAGVSNHSKLAGSRSWPAILYLCYSRVEQDDPLGALELLLDAGADPNAHFISWGSPFTGITGAIWQGEPLNAPVCRESQQL